MPTEMETCSSPVVILDSSDDENEPARVLCFTCGEFVLENEYDKHAIEVHTDLIECLICNQKLEFEDYEEHLSEAHIDQTEVFRCGACHALMEDVKAYQNHIHDCSQAILCYICGKFMKADQYDDHMTSGVHVMQSVGIGEYADLCEKVCRCHCCPKLFQEKSELTNHMAEDHQDCIWYTCNACRLGYRSRDEYHHHLTNTHSLSGSTEEPEETVEKPREGPVPVADPEASESKITHELDLEEKKVEKSKRFKIVSCRGTQTGVQGKLSKDKIIIMLVKFRDTKQCFVLKKVQRSTQTTGFKEESATDCIQENIVDDQLSPSQIVSSITETHNGETDEEQSSSEKICHGSSDSEQSKGSEDMTAEDTSPVVSLEQHSKSLPVQSDEENPTSDDETEFDREMDSVCRGSGSNAKVAIEGLEDCVSCTDCGEIFESVAGFENHIKAASFERIAHNKENDTAADGQEHEPAGVAIDEHQSVSELKNKQNMKAESSGGLKLRWDRGVQTGSDSCADYFKLSTWKGFSRKKGIMVDKILNVCEKDIQENRQIIEHLFEMVRSLPDGKNELLEYVDTSNIGQPRIIQKVSKGKVVFGERVVHFCSLCSEMFFSRRDLAEHLKNHPSFICECQVVFLDVGAYRSHLKDHHGKRILSGNPRDMKLLSYNQSDKTQQGRIIEGILLDNLSSTKLLGVREKSKADSTVIVRLEPFPCYPCVCGKRFRSKNCFHIHLSNTLSHARIHENHGYQEMGVFSPEDVYSQEGQNQAPQGKKNLPNASEAENQDTKENDKGVQGQVDKQVQEPRKKHCQGQGGQSPQGKGGQSPQGKGGQSSQGKGGQSSQEHGDWRSDHSNQGQLVGTPQSQEEKGYQRHTSSQISEDARPQRSSKFWYGCTYCPMAFGSVPSCMRHYAGHSVEAGVKKFVTYQGELTDDDEDWTSTCTDCSIKYINETGLQNHKKRGRCRISNKKKPELSDFLSWGSFFQQTARGAPPSLTPNLATASTAMAPIPSHAVTQGAPVGEKTIEDLLSVQSIIRSYQKKVPVVEKTSDMSDEAEISDKFLVSTSLINFEEIMSQHNGGDENPSTSRKKGGNWYHCTLCPRAFATFPLYCKHKLREHKVSHDFSFRLLGLWKVQKCDDCGCSNEAIQKGQKKCDGCKKKAVEKKSQSEKAQKTQTGSRTVTLSTVYMDMAEDITSSAAFEKSVTVPEPYLKLVDQSQNTSTEVTLEQTNKTKDKQKHQSLDTQSVPSTFSCEDEDEGSTKEDYGDVLVKTEASDSQDFSEIDASEPQDFVKTDALESQDFVKTDASVSEDFVKTDALDSQQLDSQDLVKTEQLDSQDFVKIEPNGFSNADITTSGTVAQIKDTGDAASESIISSENHKPVCSSNDSDAAADRTVGEVLRNDSQKKMNSVNKKRVSTEDSFSVISGTGFVGGDATEWTMLTPIVTVKKETDSWSLEVPCAGPGEDSPELGKEDEGSSVRKKARTALQASVSESVTVDGGTVMKMELKPLDHYQEDAGDSSETLTSGKKKKTKRKRSKKSRPTQKRSISKVTEFEESEDMTGDLEIRIKSEPLSESEDTMPDWSQKDESTEDLPDHGDSGRLVIDEGGKEHVTIKQEPPTDEDGVIPEQALTNMVYIHEPSEKIFSENQEATEEQENPSKSTSNLCKCGVCGVTFTEMQSLVRHIKTHVTVTKQFKCPLCNESFTDLNKAVEHKASHGSKLHECPVCKKSFHRPWHLKEHLETHKNFPMTPGNICQVCGSEFKEYSSLRKHMHSHFKDKERGISSDGSPELMNLLSNIAKFPCDECDQVFNSKNRRAVHIRYVHRGEPRNHCELCDRTFYSPSELQRHFRTHTGERPFACGVCGKAFALATTLKDHLMSHTGERPFKCTVCGKSYSSSSILGRHKITHMGLRKHKCSICGKDFQYANSLTIHLRTHTNERPYTCDICKKTFTMSCHYRVHMRIHTGEKPYKCKYCQCRFNNYGSHYRHVRTHSEWKEDNESDKDVDLPEKLDIEEVAAVDSGDADDIEGKILPFMLSSALSSKFLLQQAVKDESISHGNEPGKSKEKNVETGMLKGNSVVSGTLKSVPGIDASNDQNILQSMNQTVTGVSDTPLTVKVEGGSPGELKLVKIKMSNLHNQSGMDSQSVQSLPGQPVPRTFPVRDISFPMPLIVPTSTQKPENIVPKILFTKFDPIGVISHPSTVTASLASVVSTRGEVRSDAQNGNSPVVDIGAGERVVFRRVRRSEVDQAKCSTNASASVKEKLKRSLTKSCSAQSSESVKNKRIKTDVRTASSTLSSTISRDTDLSGTDDSTRYVGGQDSGKTKGSENSSSSSRPTSSLVMKMLLNKPT